MDFLHTFTADTPDVVTRLREARQAHAKQTPAARMERLRNLQAKIDDLDRRGLLRRKQFEGGIPLTERVVGFHVGRRG